MEDGIMRTKILVIGFGFMGQTHAGNLLKNPLAEEEFCLAEFRELREEKLSLSEAVLRAPMQQKRRLELMRRLHFLILI